MSRPVVSIVGRPNVGKSSIFNKLLGRRKALVQDTPGVTRDRNYSLATLGERPIILCDTGGFEEHGVIAGGTMASHSPTRAKTVKRTKSVPPNLPNQVTSSWKNRTTWS